MRIVRLAAVLAVLAVLSLGLASTASAAVTWCGTDQAAADRAPDASNGLEWHVIYAFPSDGADNFGTAVSGIATDLEAVDNWWNSQDPSRRIRFDLFAFPGCAPGFGGLDISHVQLANPASAYAPLASRDDRLVGDLNAAGFTTPDKKYLVFYDGPVDDPKTCGQGNAGLIDGGRLAFALVFLGACGQTLGTATGTAPITAVHEMIHAMNALPSPFPNPGPPHVCSSEDQGHPCDNAEDILYPTGTQGEVLTTKILDAGRDDYYGHSGPWWDIQDSPFLIRVGGPDQSPPTGPASFRPSSDGRVVTLSWSSAHDDVGPIIYRVYRDGALFATTDKTGVNLAGKPGETMLVGVRAADAAGFLGPLLPARFKVGYGIVDESGKVVQDTVPPPRVGGLRGSLSRAGLVLRWHAVKDPGGIKGYLVERNGKRFRVVKGTSLAVPTAKAKGVWSVRAVDQAGNVGARFGTLKVG